MQKIKTLLLLINLLIIGIFIWQAPFLYSANKVGINYLKKLIEAHDIIKTNNIDREINSEDLFNSAINGMAQSIDIFSSYKPSNEVKDKEKSFYGIGVLISHERVSKLSLLKLTTGDSPAKLAGIKDNDILLAINDININRLSEEHISQMIF